MTILDEPPPGHVTVAGWICPHCRTGVHHDQADDHLKACPDRPNLELAVDGRERTLDQLNERICEFNRRHPNLFTAGQP